MIRTFASSAPLDLISVSQEWHHCIEFEDSQLLVCNTPHPWLPAQAFSFRHCVAFTNNCVIKIFVASNIILLTSLHTEAPAWPGLEFCPHQPTWRQPDSCLQQLRYCDSWQGWTQFLETHVDYDSYFGPHNYVKLIFNQTLKVEESI